MNEYNNEHNRAHFRKRKESDESGNDRKLEEQDEYLKSGRTYEYM